MQQLAYFMAPRASIFNVVLLSTGSCLGLNVWHKRVKRVLCSSLLPRGLDLGWLSFVSSILMTCFRQTFGNAFLAGKNYFLEEISFHTAKWMWRRGSLCGKGGKLPYQLQNKTQSNLDLLDWKKVGHKWSRERQNTYSRNTRVSHSEKTCTPWSLTNYPCPRVICNSYNAEFHWTTLWLLSCCTLLQPVKHDFLHKLAQVHLS